MTRKDRFYRRGLFWLGILFALQSLMFGWLYLDMRKENKRLENNSNSLRAFVSSLDNANSWERTLDSSRESSPLVPSSRVFPYSEIIGRGQTKSSKGRLMFYEDIRTYVTNGLFSTQRRYIPTPFFKTNAPAVRGSARGGV